ncbi:MAG: cobalt-precorrin-6A reductase [Paracoccaceae bacterium]
MQPNLLILGGTTEATAISRAVAAAGLKATVSLAGRVERPASQPVPRRIGGFGGITGLAEYLRVHRITHVIDATHPFAARMSRNAIAACAQTSIPLVAFTRPGWTEAAGDHWQRVVNINAAATSLACPPRRVMLAVGRMHLDAFARNPQHFYLLRLVDEPETPPAFPNHHVLLSRGPFSVENDQALMQEFAIELVVSKNSGGTGAFAKIAAARALALPVLMIDRPSLPNRTELFGVQEVLDWIHGAIDRGV